MTMDQKDSLLGEMPATPSSSAPTNVDSSDAEAAAAKFVRLDDLMGTTLNQRYLIEGPLGHGGMGQVYLAKDLQLHSRPVVVKVLLEDAYKDQYMLKKFRQEIEALSRIHHPGVVGIIDSGELAEAKPFIVMEYVHGMNLRSALRPEGMDFERASEIIKQIGRALTAAHEKGIFHRDLKPENIMLQDLGRGEELVKIIDFGIAKIKQSVIALSTANTATAGTIAYMSPEQLRGARVTAASDIYSLGIIAYEMLTGRRPFNPETIAHLAEMQRDGVRVRPADLRPRLSGEAQAIILRALTFEATGRQQNAADFGEALAKALTNEGSSGSSSTATTVAVEALQTKRTPRVSKWFVLGVIALLVAASALVAYRFRFPGRSRAEPAKAESNPPQSGVHRLYWQMAGDEQKEFVRQQAQRISMMLGPSPYRFEQGPLDRIKQEVDNYVARKDSLSPELFKEGLRPLYSRASLYAPSIGQAFSDRRVPPVIGLYIAMIETEYHPCSEGAFGGKGLFAFDPQTALLYGVAANERCDPAKMSRAAAHYMDDLIAEFGSDSASVTLVILSYNRGQEGVRRDLHFMLNRGIRERSYWALAANVYANSKEPKQASLDYVPKFFAAAVIGENPQAFDLQIQPLSSYSQVMGQTDAH